MIRQCCSCRKIWKGEQWIYPRFSELESYDVTHCYCDDCFAVQMSEIQARRPGPLRNTVGRIMRIFH